MKSVIITDENGLHARPASEIVAATRGYDGEVWIFKSGIKCNAKSVLMLMSLAIVKGDKIEIVAEGEDSDKMESIIENIIKNSDKEGLL